MTEFDFISALDDCIDRVAAGESIESCLADYPAFAGQLGDLLAMGELVHWAVYPETEVTDAQARVQQEILETMQKRKRKNSDFQRRHELIVTFAAAAATIIIVLGAILFTWMQPDDSISSVALGNTGTARLALQQTETEIACQTLTAQVPQLAMAGTSTPGMMLTLTEPAMPLEMTTTAMATGTPLPTPTMMAMTTASPIPMSATPMPTPAALPTMDMSGEIVPTSVAVMSPLPFPTATPTINMGGGLVVTSTMTRLERSETATPPAPLVVTAGVDSMTGIPTLTPIPTTVPWGANTPEAILTHQVSATPTVSGGNLPEIMPLSAGEIDDNTDWDTYLLYRHNYLREYAYTVHDVDVVGRHIIRVVDGDGLPVIGARVRVYLGEALVGESCTYADGRTLFFPNAQPASQNAQSFRVVVEKDDSRAEFTLDPSRRFVWSVVLEDVRIPRDNIQLDVLFLLDSTGSMADEIAQLQNNILHISAQIDALGGINTRFGLITYRDRGDQYVVRNFGFTPDVAAFQANLNSVRADGGGDHPESVNEALHEAVRNVDWRGGNTVQLVFLVADAQPHLDYAQDYDYAQEIVYAAQTGIKIHPIASSGLEPAGEFIFRQIAQYTMGHFIFLTYEDSQPGTPGTGRADLNVGEPDEPGDPQDQGDYTVEQLDELVLRLITDELAALRGGEIESASQETEITHTDGPPCVVTIRTPPPTAPTRIPSGGSQEPDYIDPHVAVCLTSQTIHVGDTFRIYAQAVDVGLPVYQLTLNNDDGGMLTFRFNPSTLEHTEQVEAAGLELIGIEQVGSWNVSFVFRATRPEQITGSVYASGEIHYGYPGPATWAGGSSDPFGFEILGN